MRVLILTALLFLAGCGNQAPNFGSDDTSAGNWVVTVYAGAERVGQYTTDGPVRWSDHGAPRCRFKDKSTGKYVIIQGTCIVTQD